jgi:hypothetical protein
MVFNVQAGVDFEDVRWSDDAWDSEIALLKPTLPYGQVPLYEVSAALLSRLTCTGG